MSNSNPAHFLGFSMHDDNDIEWHHMAKSIVVTVMGRAYVAPLQAEATEESIGHVHLWTPYREQLNASCG